MLLKHVTISTKRLPSWEGSGGALHIGKLMRDDVGTEPAVRDVLQLRRDKQTTLLHPKVLRFLYDAPSPVSLQTICSATDPVMLQFHGQRAMTLHWCAEIICLMQ